MELLRVQTEMENLTEKKNLYNQMYEKMNSKYKKSHVFQFVQKFLPKKKTTLTPKNNSQNTKISISDVEMCEQKLKIVNQELVELERQYNEKNLIYKEVVNRAQEINDRKKSYSDQLCEFLSLIK